MDHNYPSEYSADVQGETSQESTLAGVRAVISQLEADHKSKGIKLSGRIIHVTHYLPIVTALKPKSNGEPAAPISPPKTPEADIVSLEAEKAHKSAAGRIAFSDEPFLSLLSTVTEQPPAQESAPAPPISPAGSTHSLPEATSSSKWHLTPRRGHTAMVSGIRSLCATHEQIILAWTGDIESGQSEGSQKQLVKSETLSQEDKN
ncbi:16433_t:CDS:2, partial [Acaulospora colombiana]